MILKLGMQHQELKLYIVYINDDPGLTLTFLTARSNWVPMNLNEETVTKSFKWENFQQRTKLTE